MREILFRGKRTDNDEGEFVYGIPVEGEPLLGMGKRTYIITKPGVQWVDGVYMTYDECIEVEPETVGQYTGLTDKNGRKIFEGDIVKWTDSLYKVVFERRFGTAYFGIKISNFETWYFCNSCAANLMEIAGNIYDNPELMKGGIENG